MTLPPMASAAHAPETDDGDAGPRCPGASHSDRPAVPQQLPLSPHRDAQIS